MRTITLEVQLPEDATERLSWRAMIDTGWGRR